MGVCKVIYGENVLVDLTEDTVTPADLAEGKTAHDASGELITGTNPGGIDTSDATAEASEILAGKTAYVNDEKLTGTMLNRESVTSEISSVNQVVNIQEGYHSGSGTVTISSNEQAKIIADNIKSGVQILGVTGTHEGGTDLSEDTVTAEKLLAGTTAHNASGEKITGTMTNNGAVIGSIETASGSYIIPAGYHNGSGSVAIASSEQAKIIPENIKAGVNILGVEGSASGEGEGTDTSDATASASDILSGQTAYVDGEKVTGTMINRGQVTGSISFANDVFAISQGYHDGTGSVMIDSAEQAKIVASNIKSGVSILGVTGDYEGEAGGGVDTTNDTITAAAMIAGTTAHDANGNLITGTMVNRGSFSEEIRSVNQVVKIPQGYHDGTGTVQIRAVDRAALIDENIRDGVDVLDLYGTCPGINTRDDTVVAEALIEGLTAHNWRGEEITGTMPSNGDWCFHFDNLSELTQNDEYDSISIPDGYHESSEIIIDKSIENIIPENIKSGVEILGVTGTAKTFTARILTENRFDVRDFSISPQSSQLDFSAQVTYNANNDSDYFDEYAVEENYLYNIYFPYNPENAKAVFSYDSTANRTEDITNCFRIMHDGKLSFYYIAPANGYLLVSRGDGMQGGSWSGNKSYYKIEVTKITMNWGSY